MTDLLALFDDAAAAQRAALAGIRGPDRRRRTSVPGQYALDVVADEAILAVLHGAPVRVLSEESGITGRVDAEITVIVDPVDGSTNCARGIPYWGISLCALDASGARCALVENGATGARSTATRGEGAWADGARLAAARTTRIEDAVVAVTGLPARSPGWKQFRALGSTALGLCDVASGGIDGLLDFVDRTAPWDYLGGLLVCLEAGACVMDADGRELVVADPAARRQLVAAATPELAAVLRRAVRP